MKEEFLHHVWRFKRFDVTQLFTTSGDPIQLLRTGDYLQTEGPDFFNAQLIIGSQKWAGMVEIHLKSSDWYAHHHEQDPNYENVILHVVWEHDMPVFRKNNTELPVLELKDRVEEGLLNNYLDLMLRKEWISCERELQSIPQFVLQNWLERLYFERLARKSEPILKLLEEYQNDWESVLFVLLAKNFGLNTNGEAFAQVAQSIQFSIFRKEALDVHFLEALLFGQSGLFPDDPMDVYTKELVDWYAFLQLKYRLERPVVGLRFFKLRPDNFPTLRLAQLAMVYHKRRHLFQSILERSSLESLIDLFQVGVSSYWETHYNFDKPSSKKQKQLSEAFIHLVLINTILPLKFAYAQHLGKFEAEEQLILLQHIPPEKNSILEKFNQFGIQATNAQQSQALIELKKQYCDVKKCLNCAIGIELLKRNT